MNNNNRYPFIDFILNAISSIAMVVIAIAAIYVAVRVLRFLLPKITFVGLIIMVPITIFGTILAIGLISDIIRYIKDRRSNRDDTQQY